MDVKNHWEGRPKGEIEAALSRARSRLDEAEQDVSYLESLLEKKEKKRENFLLRRFKH